MARLTGKVAPITGAAGGQGAAEAELFVREEGAVVLTDIDTAAGEALAQRLSRQRSSPNSCAMTLEPSTGFGSMRARGQKSALPRLALL
jgi:NAD(P)-dependent dehydrogenase (short-subunit alcohol dehydrogenase family)